MLHFFHYIPNFLGTGAKLDKFSINSKGFFCLQDLSIKCFFVNIRGDLSNFLLILLSYQSPIVIICGNGLWSSHRMGVVNAILWSARAV